MRHIQPPDYVRIETTKANFEQIFKCRLTNIEVEKKKYKGKLTDKTEFIRFVHEAWYMDVTIRKIVIKDHMLIHLDKIIDYNKPKLK